MPVWVALFRGLNVGGKNRLPMRDLVALLEDLGCRNVETCIQSGNAVFESPERDAARLSQRVRGAVEKRHGFAPLVLVLDSAAIGRAMAENPFPDATSDPRALHLGFLAASPGNPDLQALAGLKKPSERFQLCGRVFYLHAPEGIGRSKLAASAERLLGVPMTDRNWNTVRLIGERARARGASNRGRQAAEPLPRRC